MICTCDNCHYTFEAPSLPASCPDCGKELINRRISNKVISSAAVRPATEDEMQWYHENQSEQAAEDERNERLNSLESYDMTDEEYNWAMVMLEEHNIPRTDDSRASLANYLHSFPHDPDRAIELYKTVRRMFSRKIGDDRSALEKAGEHEPYSVAYINDEGENVLKDDLDDYGPALSVLYRFKPYDFLHTPTLGDLRRIDLEKIAREPSAGYLQFLLDWENSLI